LRKQLCAPAREGRFAAVIKEFQRRAARRSIIAVTAPEAGSYLTQAKLWHQSGQTEAHTMVGCAHVTGLGVSNRSIVH
jgi:hypothetical protein